MDLLFTDALKFQSPHAFGVMVKPAGPLCNLNCTYCYYLGKKSLFSGTNKFRLNEELLEYFIREYIESVPDPNVTFVWQGGEPTLLGLDYFRKAIDLQRKYSNGKIIGNAFQTNGTLLNDEWCRFFADNKILVGISIDGEEHNHDHYRRTAAGGATFRSVMKGIELLHRNKAEFNTLSCVNSYNVNYASETYRFLKHIGSGYIQFLPVVERLSLNENSADPVLTGPEFKGDATVAEWSVPSKAFGKFLITIFNEWVRSDVARYYVQIFDATLANHAGEVPGLCVFAETCGDALVMEHNGDMYSCDHFVFPEYFLGNITAAKISDLAQSARQFDFGIAKRNNLPLYCLKCDVRYVCHGECPKHRFILTPDGKPGLNYLCEGYKMFFRYVKPYMEFMARELKSKRAPANVMSWVRNRENQAVKPAVPERNDLCPCGSGKKFKHCCAGRSLLRF
jgi:uncharacterized protein